MFQKSHVSELTCIKNSVTFYHVLQYPTLSHQYLWRNIFYDCKIHINYLEDKHLFPRNLLSISVSPEVVIVPIVSSILIFPIVAFIVICCLRKRAARARQKARMAKRWVISLFTYNKYYILSWPLTKN